MGGMRGFSVEVEGCAKELGGKKVNEWEIQGGVVGKWEVRGV